MKLTNLLTVSALTAAMMSPVVMADTSKVSPEQKKQFETIIHDYLISNPEVLMEASQALQAKQQVAQQSAAKSAIVKNVDQLLTEKLAVAGNPKGNVTVVEFFDYQCGHCKSMRQILTDLISKDSNVRVIYKEFPIFGKTSEIAAKGALAAGMQGKYIPMHDALLKTEKHMDNDVVMDTAKSLGLNLDKFKLDMDSKAVADELAANRVLAEKLHLMGTPAFVVLATPAGVFKAGSETGFVPGGTSAEALQALVAKAVTAGK